MADFLTINGWPLAIADGSAQESDEFLGNEDRAFSGAQLLMRRALKSAWDLQTPPMTAADARALVCLLRGEGHHWPFDDATDWQYSDKGLPKTSGTGTGHAASGKFGGYLSIADGDDVAWAASLGTVWTVMLWKYDGIIAGWHHYAVTSEGHKWKDGVRNDALDTSFVVVASGNLTIDNATGDVLKIDDMVAFPAAMSASMVEEWGAATSAFSSLPFLNAAGELMSVQKEVSGTNIQSTAVQYMASGGWEMAGRVVSFTLVER